MVHSVALFLALVSGANGPINPPLPSAGCYKSQFVLGTSNVPVSSGRSTTVINIWAVLKPKKYVPIAWIYKNVAGQFWIQANNKRSKEIREIFSPRIAKHILTGSSSEYLPVPWRMPSLGVYDGDFTRIGASRHPCFTHDLASKYYSWE